MAKKRAPKKVSSPRRKVASPARKVSKKAPAVKKKAPESPPKEPTPAPNEEKLLARRLAALRAQAEEKALREKLARLKSSRKAKASGGLSLGTGVSQEFARRLMAHLKSFWAVPEVLEDREDLTAEVELKIAPDGRLLSYRFLRRSGEPLFDEAVVATLKKAEPLPAPGQTLTLSAVFKIR
ncbi:MAG: TonB C-terminal domain-containing protein [Thermodesulfobacteria bacterium]|nr:TonB C-terminal domain-containing protein [Thermodesulfobacteriota bacterium]